MSQQLSQAVCHPSPYGLRSVSAASWNVKVQNFQNGTSFGTKVQLQGSDSKIGHKKKNFTMHVMVFNLPIIPSIYRKIIWDLDKSASSTCFSSTKLGVLLPRCLSLCGDFGATPLLELRTRRSLPQMEFRVLELNIIKPNCTSNLTDSTPQKNMLFALFPQMI